MNDYIKGQVPQKRKEKEKQKKKTKCASIKQRRIT